ncbi:MAG: hypothetical protein IJ043_00315 [Clostridia bacterium]|nr:hypothetical protein [Clostridia bacterium]
MAKKSIKKQDIINGRISLLFFYLLLLAGLLWLERFARYRYDLILRPMLPWLLPVLFGVAAAGFAVLLILWIKKGRKDSEKLFSLSFTLLLPIPLMAAFLLPWLADLAPGFQFFRLATDLVLYAAIGGFAGYIGYYTVGKPAAWLAAASTLDILALFYFYERFLTPSSFILNTSEFGYLPDFVVGLILMGVVAAANLLLQLFKCGLRPYTFLLPAGLAVILLGLNALISFGITPIRWMIFGGMALIGVWYITWCVLKKKNIL